MIAKKRQTINLELDSDKIYDIYKIELINSNQTERQFFYLPIYINKINKCYINLRPKKRPFCFQYIFYKKTGLDIPKHLLYKNGIKLTEFDFYNLKYRKKINVINVEKSFANKYIKTNLSLDNNSYKICVRINQNGKELSSVHEIRYEEKSNTKISTLNYIKNSFNEIKTIYQLFKEFKENKSIQTLKQNKKYKHLTNGCVFNRFIKQYIYANKSYSEMDNINENDVNILCQYYFFYK